MEHNCLDRSFHGHIARVIIQRHQRESKDSFVRRSISAGLNIFIWESDAGGLGLTLDRSLNRYVSHPFKMNSSDQVPGAEKLKLFMSIMMRARAEGDVRDRMLYR